MVLLCSAPLLQLRYSYEGRIMGRRSANEGSIYKRKRDGLWTAQYLVDTPEGKTKRKYIYGKKRKDVADKLAEVQREGGGCRQPHRYGLPDAVDGL